MPTFKNFVAVDWRAGKDKIYFFFKDTNQYSRFDLDENKVEEGYPADITAHNWGGFHAYAKNLRFGFTSSALGGSWGEGDDILWLFYYVGDTPMVCKYDQDLDKVTGNDRVENSLWRSLLPYFDRIVAGTWWETAGLNSVFKSLTNDGYYITFNYETKKTTYSPITSSSWPGLYRYKNRIITAVQNDAPLIDTYYYIFLTNNEYIRYDLKNNRAETGPIKVNDTSWPGLMGD
ncbi:hypothetical protein [Pseudomonas frederiksbergensis]|uniref:Uncharacterized protein n=1 Tax=Pseudomonas frederiksbergensis TaxID=104087 RepID=A0A423HTJ8_9PSED|nr:hypothetical protein [Pseudomonas frederiksbergensis]RON16408.1 hypothetical protein BK662_07705 [Pseudomonas frederiksbergensis]